MSCSSMTFFAAKLERFSHLCNLITVMTKAKSISLKDINKLAIPAILAGIAEPLIGLADTAIVGHLGATELAAVGIGSGLFLFFIWTLSSMKSAISSIVAQYFGKEDLDSVKTLVPQGIGFALLVGIMLIVGTVPTSSFVLEFFYQAKGSLLNMSEDYYSIRAFGYPFTLATFTIFGVFRGCQNTLWAMKISIIGGLVNIVLDYVFVYGIFIPEPLGIEGAAYATLVAQVLMFVLSMYILITRYSHTYMPSLKLNPELRTMLVMFVNLFLRTIFLNVAYSLAIRLSTQYGEDQIAAHTIAMNIWLFSAFFIDGYANAGNAIAGRLIGQGNNEELYRVGIQIAKISTLIGGLLGLFYLALYPWIGNAFTSEAGVLTMFKSIFYFVIISQPINGIAFALDGIFKGLGRTSLLRNTLFLGTFLVFIPVVFFFDYLDFEMTAVWLAFTTWMMFRSGSLIYVFIRDYKR